jgi:hypothetical protein
MRFNENIKFFGETVSFPRGPHGRNKVLTDAFGTYQRLVCPSLQALVINAESGIIIGFGVPAHAEASDAELMAAATAWQFLRYLLECAPADIQSLKEHVWEQAPRSHIELPTTPREVEQLASAIRQAQSVIAKIGEHLVEFGDAKEPLVANVFRPQPPVKRTQVGESTLVCTIVGVQASPPAITVDIMEADGDSMQKTLTIPIRGHHARKAAAHLLPLPVLHIRCERYDYPDADSDPMYCVQDEALVDALNVASAD